MPKKFWQFRNQAAGSAELLLYGDISDSSWWGDEVTPKTFADELNALGALTSLTVRINSGGGDVFAAQTIGNLLEQHTAQVTARIDGLCASAATIIACHCDKVVAANDSTYMIHPVRMGIFDFADAVTLQQYIGALNTIRENILNLYTKKTGREKDEVAAWMDATSWWTGEEAKTNGFVDELVDDGEKTVVENRGGLLFVNSVNMNLPFNKAPKFVQNSVAAAPAASGFVNTPTPAEQPGDNSHKEDTNMANEMPIGNLTSQLFANIYLNELDQYCKHKLKIHYYIRYMDDVIILGQDKETLHRWKAAVETFLREELALDLNSKTSIRPVRQGVEFVGVRIWPTHMKLRKSTVRRIKREVRKISALYAAGDMTRQDFYRRIASIRGLLKHTESASLRWRLNEIYRAELEKAKQKQLREEAQHEPFADHSGAGNGDGNAGTGYQDHGNPACRAG